MRNSVLRSFILAILVWLFSGLQVFGHSTRQDESIQKLIFQARQIHKKSNNAASADSLLKEAIELAEMTYENEVILKTLNEYFECMDQGTYDKMRLSLAAEAEDLCKKVKDQHLVWRSYYNLADVYLSNFLFDQAQEFGYKAYSLAEGLQQYTLKVPSYIVIGKILEKRNHLIEAFKNYLQALSIAEGKKNISLLDLCYKTLSSFYNLSKNFDKAIEYKLKQSELLKKKSPVDSLSLMWIQFELECININSRRNISERNIESLLKFAGRHHEERLKSYTISIYRTYLVDSDNFGKLTEFYTQKYPEELQKLALHDQPTYYRIKALIQEFHQYPDSACQSFQKAIELIQPNPNKVLKSELLYPVRSVFNPAS